MMSCVVATTVKTFKSLAESQRGKLFTGTPSQFSSFTSGNSTTSRAPDTFQERLRLAFTCFLSKPFSLLTWAAWSRPWGCGYSFSMHVYSDAEIYRGQKMWKEHEQKARSSVCVFSTGFASLVGAQFHLRLWIMQSGFPCSARGLSTGQALRWGLQIFTFRAPPAFCTWPDALEEDKNDKDMKRRSVVISYVTIWWKKTQLVFSI